MPKGYKITRSNYTLKKRHQTVSGGVVYERDFMVTTNLGGWSSGSIPYGENNFKFYYNEQGDAKKRPYNGDWLKNDCNETNPEIWTANCVPSSGTSEKEQIKIKQNYNSMLDFAYYGSCVELVKSTITKIIKEFPAEMYTTDGDYYGFEGDVILINNFDIDLKSKNVPEGENEMRYFLVSYYNYSVIIGEKKYGISSVSISGTTKDIVCDTYNIEITLDSGETYNIWSKRYQSGFVIKTTNLPSGARIFPSDESINNFFNNKLDDFGKVLLNLNTNPIYTAVLDTPRETERGIESYRVTYTWPTENNWNILVEGGDFRTYIDGLLSIAELYDEYYTNNLWRMLTHDSIKAMDIAFSNPEKDEDQDDYNEGTTRLEGIFWAIGRQFDDIKRAIDNIKNSSRITYDGNNNLPDYFLSDTLNLAGWEIYNIDTYLSKYDKTEAIFKGILNGFTANDANNIFLRNLRLNSRNILSKKGTREGIEEILGLFGMVSYDKWKKLSGETYDYKIDEYVGIVTNSYDVVVSLSGESGTNEEVMTSLETANMQKLSVETDTPEGQEMDTTVGIPCSVKYVLTTEGEYKYIVPWFDKKKDYDGNLYYQARGGWGYHEIPVTGMTWTSMSGYDETVKYIILVSKVSDLRNVPSDRLYDGIIAYVDNIIDEENNIEYQSHYFVLQNKEYYYYIEKEGGWYNITEGAVREGTPEGRQIYYVEHIVEDFLANNPHVGYGGYDFGQEYIDYLETPLKYCFDKEDNDEEMFYESAYDCNGNLIFSGKTFDINGNVSDNMKCWYFEPAGSDLNEVKLLEKDSGSTTYHCVDTNDFSISSQKSGATFDSDIYAFDFLSQEKSDTADELTCDSIINTKRMSIVFNTKKEFYDEFCKFLSTTVLPYLRQMLPSDVIFSYKVVQYDVADATVDRTTGNIRLKGVDSITSSSEEEENDDIIINYPSDRNILISENTI